MSEYLAAEIFIGGTLARSQVAAFCQVIAESQVELDQGDGPFHPESASDLLDVCILHDQVAALRLYDDSARWGRFEALEAFCVQYRLPFRRYSEGKYEYDPELVVYEPGSAPVTMPTNAERVPVVSAADVRPALDKLAVAATYLDARKFRRGKKVLRDAQIQLENLLPGPIPPLTPFRISRAALEPKEPLHVHRSPPRTSPSRRSYRRSARTGAASTTPGPT